jgi:mono/diheme cytochrome c family protein
MKKSAQLLFAALLAVTIAACGGNDGTETSDNHALGGPAGSDNAATSADTGDTVAAPPCPPGSKSQNLNGAELFAGKGLCFTCHGKDGSGSSLGPSLRDTTWRLIRAERGEIANLIRRGVPSSATEYSTPMPPRGGANRTDEEVCALTEYVHMLAAEAASSEESIQSFERR